MQVLNFPHAKINQRKIWTNNVAWCVFGTLLAISAYNVYCNEVKELPTSVNFFWFSLFATGAIFFLKIPKQKELMFHFGRPKLNNPQETIINWLDSFTRGSLWYVLWSSLGYFLYFAFLLTSLKIGDKNMAITALVALQLRPIIHSASGHWVFGDSCRSWIVYVLGALVTLYGAWVYKMGFGLPHNNSWGYSGKFILLMSAVIICDSAWMIARRHYTKKTKIDTIEVMKTIQLFSTILCLGWMIIDGHYLPNNPRQFIALVYLGIVPTAIGLTVLNQLQDMIGIPLYRSISNLGPAMCALIGWIYLRLSPQNAEPMDFSLSSKIGITFSILGVAISMFLGKPEDVENLKAKTV